MAFDTRLLSGLNVFVSVVEAGSFARAAVTLGLTQSGVSRSIQRLEERLGVRLLERTSKVMRLTEEGRDFHGKAMPLLSGLEEAADDAARASALVGGRLRVNVDPTFARLVLAPRIGSFLGAHPDLHLELVIRDQIGDLVAEGFDAAVRFGEPGPSTLIARRLLRTQVLTCASPAYLSQHGRPHTPRALSRGHECLLFRDPTTGAPFAWEFHQGKKRISVPVIGRLIVNDALTHLEACRAGFGVAQIFALGSTLDLASGQLVNLF